MTGLRIIAVLLALAAGAAGADAAVPAAPATPAPSTPAPAAETIRVCDSTPDSGIAIERRLEACTALIDGGGLDDSQMAAALADRAAAYYLLSNYPFAIRDFEAALARWPDKKDTGSEFVLRVTELLAMAYQDAGREAKAVQAFEFVLAARPGFPEAIYGRGRSFNILGLATRGRQDLDEAIRLQPDFAEAYVERGMSYILIGDITRAIGDFDHAILQKPELAGAYYGRGQAYSESGRFDLAVQDFDRASQLAPDFPAARAARNDAQARNDAWNARLAAGPPDGDSALAPIPGTIMPSRPVGRSHDCSWVYPKASKRLLESGEVRLSYDVDAKGAIRNVALVKTSGSTRLDRAALDCVGALWRNTPAQQNGAAIASPGHQAIVRYAIDRQVAGNDFQIRAGGYVAIGDYEHALDDVNTAIGLDASQSLAFYHRGLVYYLMGQMKQAKADFEQALRLKPGDVDSQDALDLVNAELSGVSTVKPPRDSI